MTRRRKRRSSPGVDLFSFLNLMAATIGVQALMIVISALQIKPGVQAIQLLPAGGEASGAEGNYIILNGNADAEVAGQGERRKLNLRQESLNQFLDQIASNPEPQYLVIGVRPNAYRDFETVREKAEAKKIKIGYEPLEADLKIKFPSMATGPVDSNGQLRTP